MYSNHNTQPELISDTLLYNQKKKEVIVSTGKINECHFNMFIKKIGMKSGNVGREEKNINKRTPHKEMQSKMVKCVLGSHHFIHNVNEMLECYWEDKVRPDWWRSGV